MPRLPMSRVTDVQDRSGNKTLPTFHIPTNQDRAQVHKGKGGGRDGSSFGLDKEGALLTCPNKSIWNHPPQLIGTSIRSPTAQQRCT
jgi:hypothetical protein